MPKRKPFNRNEVVSRTAKRINLSNKFKRGSTITLGLGAVVSITEIMSARTKEELLKGVGTAIGAAMGGIVVGQIGNRMQNELIKKCVGKPRVSSKVAEEITDRKTRIFFRALGEINWKNQTIRQGIMSFVKKERLAQLELNIIKRELQRALKIAEEKEIAKRGK